MPRPGLCLLILISVFAFGFVSAGEGKRIKLSDGRYLGYKEYGCSKGQLVLYFHGINSSRFEAELISDEIGKSGVRLIAIDRPGMGNSTYYEDRKILDWPDDIAEFADALGYRDFSIMTVSGGASYGLACAAKLPDRVKHLALISGYAPFCTKGIKSGMMEIPIRFIANHPNLTQISVAVKTKQLEQKPKRATRALSRGWIKADRQFLLKDEEVHELVIKNLRAAISQGGDGLIKDVALLRFPWGFDVSEAKRVPVSIWSGAADLIVTPSMAWYFHTQIPGSKLVIGPGEGHATMLKNYSPAVFRDIRNTN